MGTDTMTISQLMKFIKTAEQKGMTPDRFQHLLSSGLLADLLEAYPAAVNRDEFCKLLGLSPPELFALVNFDSTLPQMIAEANLDKANPAITPELFPVEGTGLKKFRFKIFKPHHEISSGNAIELMLKAGFPAARHEAGLAFAREFPYEQLKRPIALLGSSARCFGSLNVVCLDRDGARRRLRLNRWKDPWFGRWGFLGAQEVSAA